jgi:hypothetical protein
MSLTIENFKTAFVSKIELWSSRQLRHWYRRRCRHRRSRSNVEKKEK